MSLPMIGRTAPRERVAGSWRGSVPVSAAGASCAPRDPGPRRMRGEEGLAAFVVCIPAFFLAVLLAIQFALWAHASHLARAAAEQGASTAAAYGSTPAAGTAAAYQFIATTGPSSLTTPHVTTTTATGNTVQVTISGRAQSLIPWLSLGVSSTSVEPVQQFRASG
jgi:Flp pilus assembly protein TadG